MENSAGLCPLTILLDVRLFPTSPSSETVLNDPKPVSLIESTIVKGRVNIRFPYSAVKFSALLAEYLAIYGDEAVKFDNGATISVHGIKKMFLLSWFAFFSQLFFPTEILDFQLQLTTSSIFPHTLSVISPTGSRRIAAVRDLFLLVVSQPGPRIGFVPTGPRKTLAGSAAFLDQLPPKRASGRSVWHSHVSCVRSFFVHSINHLHALFHLSRL